MATYKTSKPKTDPMAKRIAREICTLLKIGKGNYGKAKETKESTKTGTA